LLSKTVDQELSALVSCLDYIFDRNYFADDESDESSSHEYDQVSDCGSSEALSVSASGPLDSGLLESEPTSPQKTP
jgi:hypothetical protein